MQINEVAKIYANALTDDEQKYFDDFEKIKNILESSNELNNALLSPAIMYEQKIAIITDIFANEISAKMLNFLKLIAEKAHFDKFLEIYEAYKLISDERNNIQHVTITSAIKLSKEYQDKITSNISKKLNKTIETQWEINKDIIAGLVININDDILDTSIKTKLEKIKGNI